MPMRPKTKSMPQKKKGEMPIRDAAEQERETMKRGRRGETSKREKMR